ncbi:A/G-specific adenine glycosylase [Colletotrichum plurivorum]|uniref:A/G-specific adenine glycosylase n=1 Tax=Colletotrichum plurivorum TaxID=2175906 RepID=A0A8H6JIP6_9PEZI|nr:A/G-specific adenine glycosylase [Colletotrichum plurivorum]
MAPFVRVSSFLVLASFRALASTLTEYRWNAAGPLSAQARTQCLDPFSPATEGILSKELWTYPLRCVSSKQSPAGESKPAYCLFTSAPLRGYSGISIITTPEIAADAFSSDALKDSYDFWRWEERVSNLGPIWDAQGPSYAVKDIPGKGKGVVARRDIRIGEVFMLDYPVILAHRGLLDSLGPDYRQKFFPAAIEQLPETAREKVMALARISADKSNYAEDILTTNACGVFLGGTESHVGLFPEVSRINHACNASAFFRFSQRTFTMEVIAYRDIQEGEEISINCKFRRPVF